MRARRLRLMLVASLCGLVLVGGVIPTVAGAASQLGSGGDEAGQLGRGVGASSRSGNK